MKGAEETHPFNDSLKRSFSRCRIEAQPGQIPDPSAQNNDCIGMLLRVRTFQRNVRPFQRFEQSFAYRIYACQIKHHESRGNQQSSKQTALFEDKKAQGYHDEKASGRQDQGLKGSG